MGFTTEDERFIKWLWMNDTYPTYWIASSRFSTLQLGRSPVYVAQITSLTLLPVFTGKSALERINFKLAVLVYRAMHGTAPRYLSDFLRRVADLPPRRRLRSATSSQLDVRPSRLSETVHLPLLGQSSGTVSLMTLHRLHRCQFSEKNWKLTYFSNLIWTLFCSLLWFSVAIVVLEVNCYLGHVKKCNVMYCIVLYNLY